MLNREQIEYLFRGIQEEVIENIQLAEGSYFATCEAVREYTLASTENRPDDFQIWERVCNRYAEYWKTYFEDSREAADKALKKHYAASKEYYAEQSKILTERLTKQLEEDKAKFQQA